MLSITKDILELKNIVRILFDKIQLLEAKNAALKAENNELKAENSELKARLHLDSHNSSKPLSSDGLLKKPAFPRGKNSKQGGTGKSHRQDFRNGENPRPGIRLLSNLSWC